MIYRLLVLLCWTCEAEGTYNRSEASIEPLDGVGSQHGLPLNTQQRHEHLKILWDGVDLPEEVLAVLSSQKQVLQTRSKSTAKWVLLGPFDSGTNLFNMSVQSNLPQLGEAEFKKKDLRIWKHTLNGPNAITTTLQQQIAPLTLKSVVLVIMVRSPLSLISSWKKASYNLFPCVFGQYADMNRPCEAKVNCMWEGRCGEDNFTAPFYSFASTADIYNTYLGQYRQLQKDKRFKHVMLVTYEDMVLNPKAVMKKFAQAMDFVVDKVLHVVDEPAKDHGDAVGRAEALTKLESRPWLAEMGSAGLQAICPHLSKKLIGNLKEGNYGTHKLRYYQDCKDQSSLYSTDYLDPTIRSQTSRCQCVFFLLHFVFLIVR